ncbi:LOW QUALITY PROTEIN: uncharacterized protein ACB057_002829 [Neosynchiropus ocellatus]
MDEMRADIIRKFEAIISETVTKEVRAALEMLEANMKSQRETLLELETSANEHGDEMAGLEATIARLASPVDALEKKCEELEAHLRCNNMRVIGLPEGSEDGRPTEFMAKMLKELHQPDVEPILDRARRSLHVKPQKREPPRPVIIRAQPGGRSTDRRELARARETRRRLREGGGDSCKSRAGGSNENNTSLAVGPAFTGLWCRLEGAETSSQGLDAERLVRSQRAFTDQLSCCRDFVLPSGAAGQRLSGFDTKCVHSHHHCGSPRPPVRSLTPRCSLKVVLERLGKPPFEPLTTSSQDMLSLKRVLLLALASTKGIPRFKSQKKKGATGNYIALVICCGSAMASKGVKDSLVNKFGIRSHGPLAKSEMELERVRKENAHLKKKVDELKCHVKSPDSERSKLLEVVASLQAQLVQQKQAVEQKEKMLQSMSKEMESLKSMNQQATVGGLSVVQDQLRDALEKNQHWLVYDQQREAYVQSVVARSLELEKQLAEVKLRQGKNETSLDGSNKEAQLQVDCKQLILEVQSHKDQVSRTQHELVEQKAQTSKTQAELQSQREQVIRLQGELMVQKKMYEDKCGELSHFSGKYKEKCSELEEVELHLQKLRLDDRNIRFLERRDSEQEVRLKEELEGKNILLEVERKKSTELLQQVRMLQESLLSQVEQQRQMASLEQQILLSTKDFENEKANRQCIHEELHKVLKELRKARDDISHLEYTKKEEVCFSKPSSHNKHQHVTDDVKSCSRVTTLLDESFLECPNCQSTYPASRYRELLAHIELCHS